MYRVYGRVVRFRHACVNLLQISISIFLDYQVHVQRGEDEGSKKSPLLWKSSFGLALHCVFVDRPARLCFLAPGYPKVLDQRNTKLH